MPRRRARGAAVFVPFVASVALACGEPPADDDPRATITVVDAAGDTVALSGPAARVVSLVPSATQTLHALGLDSVLVGRTDFDTEAWTADVPSVGGGLEPNLEEIVARRPDLVIRFAGDQDPRTPARLTELGIPHLAVRPDRIEDVFAAIRLLGEVTASDARAEALVAELRTELDRLAAAVSARPRLRTAYVLGGTPPWVAGPGTYIDEIVSLAGGDNAFSDLGTLYTSVSPEELRARPIDVVLVSGAGDIDPTLVPGARVVDIGGALEVPGPGVAEAAWFVAERLHGVTLR